MKQAKERRDRFTVLDYHSFRWYLYLGHLEKFPDLDPISILELTRTEFFSDYNANFDSKGYLPPTYAR
jgi:hypothetical protein